MPVAYDPPLTGVFQAGQPVSKTDVSTLFGIVRDAVNTLELVLRDIGVWTVTAVAGTANAITGTLGFAEDPDTVILLVPAADNTGPVTIKLGTGPARAIQKSDSTALSAGDLRQGQPVMLRLTAGGAWRVIASGVLWSAVMASVEAETAARLAAIRAAGTIRLVNLSGTPDAIVAEMPAWAPASYADTDVLELAPAAPNTVAGPTLSVGGITRQITTAKFHDPVPVGYLRPGRRYRLKKFSNAKWVITDAAPLQEDVTAVETRTSAAEAALAGLQQDVALLETIRSPIPMAAAQAVADGPITLAPVSDSWPTVSNGYVYEFVVPLGKAAGVALVITHGGNTRTVSGGTAVALQAGDRVRYKPTSNGAATLEGVTLAPTRLQSLLDAVANAPQVVMQRDATIPDRPVGARFVFWIGPDDPGARKIPGDIWFDLPASGAPAALAPEMAYVRPTLGSLKSTVVFRGIDPGAYLPVLTGLRYAVDGGSPVALNPVSPQAAVIADPLTQDRESYLQIAASNHVGPGAYSAVKYFTPRLSATFAHPLIPRAPATSEPMTGTYGFANVHVVDNQLTMTSTGVVPDPNRSGWAETDVEGLAGTSLFAECEIVPSGTVNTTGPGVALGLNMPWAVGANVIAAAAGPQGVALVVRYNGWSLVLRDSRGETALVSGTITAPTHMRIERAGNVLRGYVNRVEVVSHDLATVAPALLDAAKGAAINVRRPSGATTGHFRARNFVAGVL